MVSVCSATQVAFVMPESPRWLVRKDRVPEAKAVLAELYPPGADLDEVGAVAAQSASDLSSLRTHQLRLKIRNHQLAALLCRRLPLTRTIGCGG